MKKGRAIQEERRGVGSCFTTTWIGAAVLLCAAGCGDQIRTPTRAEMAAFEQAGSIVPVIDMDRIEKAKLMTGPYRVVPGDVLEFTMPALLQAATAAEVQAAQTRSLPAYPYLARVRDSGAIALPAVGSMTVAGLSLAQIEEQVTEAYKDYIVLHPSVFVRVAEYRTAKVYISGAVKKPGVYALPSDQMTLSSLLTQADGISEVGAAVVRVVRSGPSREMAVPRQGLPLELLLDRPQPGASSGALEEQPPNATGRAAELPAAFDANDRSAEPGPDAEPVGEEPPREDSRSESGGLSRQPVASGADRPAARGDGGRSEDGAGLSRSDLPAFPASTFGVTPSGLSLPTPIRARVQPASSTPPLRAAPPQPPTVPASRGAGPKPILLPVVNTNIPYRDIALDEGDTVVVEPVQMPLFSVLGLVAKPGNFPYPPGAHYNLTQAIAFAGGLDPVAQPYYATIYRLQEDGSVARAPFRLIKKDKFTEALGTPIRPGDVVAVENTPRTRMNTSIRDLLRINAGVYVTGQDLWNRD